jgi:hypothetical protein
MNGDEAFHRVSFWFSPKALSMSSRQGNSPVGTNVLDQDATFLDLHRKYCGVSRQG